jgi:hypothetical protein
VLHLDGGDFLDAVQTLAGERPRREISGQEALARMVERERQRREQEEQVRREKEGDTKYALRVWNDGTCIWDTPAHAYLASQRCDGLFPPDRDAVFRFHQRCTFGGEQLPCLLTLLRNVDTDEPQAVHRTALTPDGQKIDRKMLGPKSGAAVKFWPQSCIGRHLTIGEGIETTLSAALRLKHHGLQPAWSCVDAGGLAALPLISGVQQLTILVDNDESRAGEEHAMKCTERWARAGRHVEQLQTKAAQTDFNDVIIGAL